MSLVIGILTFVLIITSLFLVLVVLMQRAKTDGGIGGAQLVVPHERELGADLQADPDGQLRAGEHHRAPSAGQDIGELPGTIEEESIFLPERGGGGRLIEQHQKVLGRPRERRAQQGEPVRPAQPGGLLARHDLREDTGGVGLQAGGGLDQGSQGGIVPTGKWDVKDRAVGGGEGSEHR